MIITTVFPVYITSHLLFTSGHHFIIQCCQEFSTTYPTQKIVNRGVSLCIFSSYRQYIPQVCNFTVGALGKIVLLIQYRHLLNRKAIRHPTQKVQPLVCCPPCCVQTSSSGACNKLSTFCIHLFKTLHVCTRGIVWYTR